MYRPVSALIIGTAVLSLMAPATADAAKEKFVRSKPHVNIGTIGHKGASEGAALTLRTVDLARGRGQDVICTFLGSINVSVPAELRDGDGSDLDGAIARWEPWVSYDVRVREGELLQLPLELPSSPTGPVPLRQAFLVQVMADDRARPVGEHCAVEWMVQVFDPSTGQSLGHYRPLFYFRTPDVTGD